jgi:hypothetical protein
MTTKTRIAKLEKQSPRMAYRNPLIMPIVDYRTADNPPGVIPVRFVDMGNGEEADGEAAKDEHELERQTGKT